MTDDITEGQIALVRAELHKAQGKFPPMQSAHEGYAIILEELEELWAEIKNDKRPEQERLDAMREEALHCCAMSLRFLCDITAPERNHLVETEAS